MPSRRLLLILSLLVVGSLLIVGGWIWSRFGVAYLRPYSEQAVFFQGSGLKLPKELAGPGPIRVVHFWDPQCPCHQETDAHLNYLIGLYRFSSVEFYSVQKPGSEGEMSPYLKGKLKPLDTLEGMESIPASPAIAIWDKNGQLAYAGPYSEGLVCNSSNSFVEPVLDALALDRHVSAANTMAVGCYCDWADRKSPDPAQNH
ncbi:DUF6436 domain-containing protein [Pseudomonas sp. LRF_L74]|uniref:DUF6436 domain-containing protein n=1 Tax=Pseudomonas sp. LRF_L74 TaxID=3369422 RepID=UPI003F60C99E